MIISGSYRTHVPSQHAPDLTCDSCGHVGPIELDIFLNCVHLFLVPFFPLVKQATRRVGTVNPRFLKPTNAAGNETTFLDSDVSCKYSMVAVFGYRNTADPNVCVALHREGGRCIEQRVGRTSPSNKLRGTVCSQ